VKPYHRAKRNDSLEKKRGKTYYWRGWRVKTELSILEQRYTPRQPPSGKKGTFHLRKGERTPGERPYAFSKGRFGKETKPICRDAERRFQGRGDATPERGGKRFCLPKPTGGGSRGNINRAGRFELRAAEKGGESCPYKVCLTPRLLEKGI